MFHASQPQASPEQYRNTNTDPYRLAAAEAASAGVDISKCGISVAHAIENEDSNENSSYSDVDDCCSSADGVNNGDSGNSSSDASSGVDIGSAGSAGVSKGLEIHVAFPKSPIVHLDPFRASVVVLGVCKLNLKIIVTPQNEIVFMASQWLGAAIGCQRSTTSSDKMRDLMKKMPSLRHGGNDLCLLSNEVTKNTKLNLFLVQAFFSFRDC
jgi:hypothetical protein